MYVRLHITCEPGKGGGLTDPLELELQMVMNHRLGAGN